MSPPLESILMKDYKIQYKLARDIVVDCRNSIGMSKWERWNEELLRECVEKIHQMNPPSTGRADLLKYDAGAAAASFPPSSNTHDHDDTKSRKTFVEVDPERSAVSIDREPRGNSEDLEPTKRENQVEEEEDQNVIEYTEDEEEWTEEEEEEWATDDDECSYEEITIADDYNDDTASYEEIIVEDDRQDVACTVIFEDVTGEVEGRDSRCDHERELDSPAPKQQLASSVGGSSTTTDGTETTSKIDEEDSASISCMDKIDEVNALEKSGEKERRKRRGGLIGFLRRRGRKHHSKSTTKK